MNCYKSILLTTFIIDVILESLLIKDDLMNNRTISLFIISLMSSGIEAAAEQIVWDKAKNHLAQYSVDNSFIMQKQIHFKNPSQSNYQLKPLNEGKNLNPTHIRYQIYYKNIPIWGHELILHKLNHAEDSLTGISVSGVERDVNDVQSRLTTEDAEKIVANDIKDSVFKNTDKIIYLDKYKARLAYHVWMYTNSPNNFVSAPNFIIDANSGAILKAWNNLNNQKLGQGLGGNVYVLPYRSGLFQHGYANPGLKSLGKFEVLIKKDKCYVKTPDIRVINVNDTDMDKGSFPVLSIVEAFRKLPTFSYTCDAASQYINKNDGDTAPANNSFSPINDTMYFATVTLEMYKKYYGVEKPIGEDLPLRAYTHIKNFDNAFAVPTVKIKGITLLHQQIVIGNGDVKLTAPAQSTIAHELSHNFTGLNSDLKYLGHSGGINEAFSDMASIAMQDYLREDFPWYWDGKDWAIGREATQGANPIRFMDEPEKDGHSIGHASNYTDKLDVHESSGVFNKAFYLLANKPHWSVRKAFQVMVDANIKYWTSTTSFEAASCGVIQAAIDRKYHKKGVVEAFEEVGVHCPINHLVI